MKSLVGNQNSENKLNAKEINFYFFSWGYYFFSAGYFAFNRIFDMFSDESLKGKKLMAGLKPGAAAV